MTEGKRKPPPHAWKPGESGNPRGRKPGAGAVAKLRAEMSAHVPALVAVLLERALAGDIGAARLLLERTVAPLKAAEESASLALPDGTLTEQGRAVVAAIAAGELAPSQGASLLTSLGTIAKLEEADDLKRRIEALEQRYGTTGARP